MITSTITSRVFQKVTKRGRKSACNIFLPSKFADDTADPNYRCFHSKVILELEYRISGTFLWKNV